MNPKPLVLSHHLILPLAIFLSRIPSAPGTKNKRHRRQLSRCPQIIFCPAYASISAESSKRVRCGQGICFCFLVCRKSDHASLLARRAAANELVLGEALGA